MSEEEQHTETAQEMFERLKAMREEMDQLRQQAAAQRKAQQDKKDADSKEWFEFRA